MGLSLGYSVVLAIVILELVFAFSIGIVCVIFSFSLFKELSISDSDEELPAGDLPSRQSLYRAIPSGNNSIHSSSHESPQPSSRENLTTPGDVEANTAPVNAADSEDVEEEVFFDFAVLNSFIEYIKIW